MIEERVDRLEIALADFSRNVGIEFNKVYNIITELGMELKAFKAENQADRDAFKAEMRALGERSRADLEAFKAENQADRDAFKAEMRAMGERNRADLEAFKAEMRAMGERNRADLEAFEAEMRAMGERSRADWEAHKAESNKKWGELSNKLGTLVEDLVFPSMPRIVRERFGQELDDFSINRKRRHRALGLREFDAVGVSATHVFLNSTKSTMRDHYVENFEKEIGAFRDYFPEYADRKIIGILASLSVAESTLALAEKRGFLCMAIGGDLMELKNSPGFQPREW